MSKAFLMLSWLPAILPRQPTLGSQDLRTTKMGGKHAVDGHAIILHHFQVKKNVFGTYQILSVPESLNLTININEPV